MVESPNAADAWLLAVVLLLAENELLPEAVVPVPIAVALPADPTAAFISPATFWYPDVKFVVPQAIFSCPKATEPAPAAWFLNPIATVLAPSAQFSFPSAIVVSPVA